MQPGFIYIYLYIYLYIYIYIYIYYMYFIVIEDVDFDISNDAIVTCELAQLWKDGALTDEESSIVCEI